MNRLLRAIQPGRSAFASIGLVAFVYAVTLWVLPREGFWIVDNANKYLQLRAILDSGYSDFSIPWPGSRLDPRLEYNPIPPPFSTVREGKLFSIFSPVFPALSSFPFRALGHGGLYVLPVTASLLMLAGLARLAGMMDRSAAVKHAAVLLAGLCTPIWFYSVVFWEHTVAVCLCVWSIALYIQFLQDRARKHLIGGSLLAAFSVYFRDELYLFCLVLLGLALLSIRDDRRAVASIAAVTMLSALAPLWVFQGIALGQPFGFHLGSHLFTARGVAEHLGARPRVLYNLFVASHPGLWASLAVAAPFLIASVLNPRCSRPRFRAAVPLYSLAALASFSVFLAGRVGSDGPIVWMLRSNSLFPAAPLLILAFLRPANPAGSGARPEPAPWIGRLALAYAALYGLAAPQVGSSGIHWGNRFVLVLYPLLALLAAGNLVTWFRETRKNRWAAPAIVLVLAVSFSAQVWSQGILQSKKAFSYRLNEAMRRRPEEVVITNIWWAPQALFSEFFDRSIFYARSEGDILRLTRLLRRNGHERFLLVTRPSVGQTASPVAQVEDDELGYFALAFFEMELR